MKHLVSLLALAACSSSPPPQATGPAPSTPVESPPSPSPAETACTSNDDCVVVQTTCCDHCNGGTVEAYNRASAAAHQLDPATCANVACTQRGCGAMTATCEAGVCKATQNPL